jgi:hypothetical protein
MQAGARDALALIGQQAVGFGTQQFFDIGHDACSLVNARARLPLAGWTRDEKKPARIAAGRVGGSPEETGSEFFRPALRARKGSGEKIPSSQDCAFAVLRLRDTPVVPAYS